MQAGLMPGLLQPGGVPGVPQLQPVVGQPTMMIPLGGGQVLFPGPQVPHTAQQQQQHEGQQGPL